MVRSKKRILGFERLKMFWPLASSRGLPQRFFGVGEYPLTSFQTEHHPNRQDRRIFSSKRYERYACSVYQRLRAAERSIHEEVVRSFVVG
jgi:hypothetical protein